MNKNIPDDLKREANRLCKAIGYSIEELRPHSSLGPRGSHDVSKVRRVLWKRLHAMRKWSVQEIADCFGFDRSSVRNSINASRVKARGAD